MTKLEPKRTFFDSFESDVYFFDSRWSLAASDVTVRLMSDVTCRSLTQTSRLIVESYLGSLITDGYYATFYSCSLRPHIVIRIQNLSESKSISRSYLFSQPAVKAKAKALLQGASGCVYT
jgi:hypothetical protein